MLQKHGHRCRVNAAQFTGVEHPKASVKKHSGFKYPEDGQGKDSKINGNAFVDTTWQS